ncbi:MAG: OmpH family outer membrane protein [Bacteroidia bacterium]|nr:OmpH family outer membrane protein [Bacteroidia bacterium]MCC6767525.1 OmpH family outer membrane protein [Bacteroidia bacterium]
MKRLALVILLFFTAQFHLAAQKFAYVDSEYILDNMPEYKSAQQQLDRTSVQWQKEIEAKFAEIDRMYKDFQAEAVLLTDEMKKKREEEIIEKEKAAKELQKQRFGKDGDLLKKRQELIKPLQDKIYNSIKEISTTKNYAVVFDKSSDLTMLFTNPKYDISDDVLENMGFTPGKNNNDNSDSGSPVVPPKK